MLVSTITPLYKREMRVSYQKKITIEIYYLRKRLIIWKSHEHDFIFNNVRNHSGLIVFEKQNLFLKHK